jgi:predicted nucleic acid-binding protein
LIAADTSTVIAYLAGETGADVDQFESAMSAFELRLPPPVLSELRAVPDNDGRLAALLQAAPLVPLREGFWDRAGLNRCALLERGLKARFADSLIAQCCIDEGVPLLTRDRDYRHFERFCGLKLLS